MVVHLARRSAQDEVANGIPRDFNVREGAKDVDFCVCHDNARFRSVLNGSDVVFCDGFGVKIAALFCGVKLGERMTPPDWIDQLFAQCEAAGHSLFFVGDEAASSPTSVGDENRI